MKAIVLIIAAASIGAALTGCAPQLPGAPNTDVVGVLKEIATDPNCAHTDRVSGNLGGLGGNNLNVFLERTCPARPASPNVVEPLTPQPPT